jgi:predicted RNA-binding protein associated with RNAse of E/G family
LLYWYCDIVDFEHRDGDNSLVVTDLLVDVVFTPEGCLKVLDLDELADALEKKIINEKQLSMALRRLNNLLTLIHKDKFDYLQAELDNLGL